MTARSQASSVADVAVPENLVEPPATIPYSPDRHENDATFTATIVRRGMRDLVLLQDVTGLFTGGKGEGIWYGTGSLRVASDLDHFAPGDIVVVRLDAGRIANIRPALASMRPSAPQRPATPRKPVTTPTDSQLTAQARLANVSQASVFTPYVPDESRRCQTCRRTFKSAREITAGQCAVCRNK